LVRARAGAMRLVIEPSQDAATAYVAAYVRQRITEAAPTSARPFVLGVPTIGATAVRVLAALSSYYQQGLLSFEHVAVFAADAYVGLPRDHPHSSHSFLWTHLLKHVNVRPEHAQLLDGNAADVVAACRDYEARIEAYGGIELFVSSRQPPAPNAATSPTRSNAKCVRVRAFTHSLAVTFCHGVAWGPRCGGRRPDRTQ
jgi:glucosamine-6-phosphate deaminase